MATGNGSKNATTASSARLLLLEARYPVNSFWEFMLQTQEKVEGRIYCTDEMSQTVVLSSALTHTVVASEIRMIHAAHIVKATLLQSKAEDDTNPSQPLPPIQKKVLEERERKSLKMVQESLRHINEKVSVVEQSVKRLHSRLRLSLTQLHVYCFVVYILDDTQRTARV